MRRHLLFIVTERTSANGVCAKSVMQECFKRGYDVSCIVNREYRDLNQFTEDGISFYTVKPRIVFSLGSYLASVRHKKLKKMIVSLIRTILNKVELMISIPTWPLISIGYSYRIFELIKKIHMKHNIDVVIPIYTQIDTIIASNKFKNLNKNIKVVPYMLDSLAAGYGPRMFSKEWIEKRGLKWEKRIFKSVDHIVMMKSSEDFYKIRNNLPYFGKISFLDIPLFVCPRKVNHTSNHCPVILYVGSIPSHIRNPKYFLDVFHKLSKDIDVRLKIVGPSTCESLLEQYISLDNRIERIQSVSHNRALEMIAESDILLNLGNNISTMMPSKIFEYISSGKPIISTAPIPNEPSIKYLKMYGNACILNEGESIDISASKLLKFLRDAHTVNPSDFSDVFKLNKPETFVDIIDTI